MQTFNWERVGAALGWQPREKKLSGDNYEQQQAMFARLEESGERTSPRPGTKDDTDFTHDAGVKAAKDVVAKYREWRQNNFVPAWKELERLGLTNVSPRAETRTMYAYHAHAAGRYNATEEEIRGHATRFAQVPLTDEERQALDRHTEVVENLNKKYELVKPAEKILKVLTGKRMASRYAGKSTLTGNSFDQGTEIYYAGADGLAPVSEVDEILKMHYRRWTEAHQKW